MLFNSAGYSFINLNLIILEHGHAIVESFHMSTQGFSSIKANLPDLLHTPAEGTTMACAPPLLRVEMNLLELTMMKLDCQPKPEKYRRSVANSSDDEQERLEITPENFRLSSTLLIGCNHTSEGGATTEGFGEKLGVTVNGFPASTKVLPTGTSSLFRRDSL
ncbi:uncharacterized protein [Physcomitrium patens]|uniref:uncharacterized protein n=1 Tax=Physcomitrium patens TaxID=3218 RepID=UPI00024AF2AD|nr:uncharacterized protein LOC112293049 [Physcomitrium patens]|eukprot:XP_024397858.1 uncharacterized protein LOC112293049 [Physcomitrella patens]